MRDSLSAAQKAYGLLWRSNTDNGPVHEARRILLATLSREEQTAAVAWAIELVGPMTTTEMIAADMRAGVFPWRSHQTTDELRSEIDADLHAVEIARLTAELDAQTQETGNAIRMLKEAQTIGLELAYERDAAQRALAEAREAAVAACLEVAREYPDLGEDQHVSARALVRQSANVAKLCAERVRASLDRQSD